MALGLVWRFLEGLGAGIDRRDPASWNTPAANLIFPDAGVIHPFGATHCEAAWYVRGIPAVRTSFAALWGTEELCCSFDGLNCTRPWYHNPLWKTRPAWFHTDQRPPPTNAAASAKAQPSPGTPTGFDMQYVQGFVNLVRTSEASGGNVVVPKSHLQFESLAREFEGGFRDENGIWIPHIGVPVGHPIFEGGIRAHLEAGDMFWWDSRTLHGNSSGDRDTEVRHSVSVNIILYSLRAVSVRESHDTHTTAGARQTEEEAVPSSPERELELLRAAVYVCMAPRARASAATLSQRRRAVRAGVGGPLPTMLTTLHCQHIYIYYGS